MRCFFATWPDETSRLALAAVSDDVSERVGHRRQTRADDLHLTLTFIGDLAEDDALALARAAQALHFRPLEWTLDRLGFFEPAGVVWAGSDAGSKAHESLTGIAAKLRLILRRSGLGYDDRPLVPHVTLLRGVRQFTAQRVAPIVWRIDSLALYRSTGGRSGARYCPVLD
ncbi:MAG: RNA 2',3'-cyclic phosphodiesterase [Burkholderiaceae bacterium]